MKTIRKATTNQMKFDCLLWQCK